MNERARKTLFWTPRVVCILFAAFISIFALDSFGGGQAVWRQIVGFLIHLIPVYLLVAVLAVTWRWEWVGAVVFPALGLFYIYWSWGRWRWPFNLYNCLTIAGPLFILGGLFLAGWLLRAQIRQRS